MFSGELLLQVIDLASSGMPQIFEKEEKNEADPTPSPPYLINLSFANLKLQSCNLCTFEN